MEGNQTFTTDNPALYLNQSEPSVETISTTLASQIDDDPSKMTCDQKDKHFFEYINTLPLITCGLTLSIIDTVASKTFPYTLK